jgi:hypothetical protein
LKRRGREEGWGVVREAWQKGGRGGKSEILRQVRGAQREAATVELLDGGVVVRKRCVCREEIGTEVERMLSNRRIGWEEGNGAGGYVPRRVRMLLNKLLARRSWKREGEREGGVGLVGAGRRRRKQRVPDDSTSAPFDGFLGSDVLLLGASDALHV